MTTDHAEIARLAAEVNARFARLRAERERLGLSPGDPLLGLDFDTEPGDSASDSA